MRRGVAQSGSAPALGAGGRRFESCHPDFGIAVLVAHQTYPSRILSWACKALFAWAIMLCKVGRANEKRGYPS